jgi:hypothetical protein
MTTPVARLGGELGYGYGLLVGPDWYGHDGAVFGWMAEWLHFSDGTVVATLQNRLDDGAAMQEATDAVLAL